MVTSARAKRVKPNVNEGAKDAAAAGTAKASTRSRDNERPLVEDIRLLGRILGDVILSVH